MSTVYKYGYDETPDYASLKALFTKELKNNGWKDDEDGLDWLLGDKKVFYIYFMYTHFVLIKVGFISMWPFLLV